jgi:hypothetical protein
MSKPTVEGLAKKFSVKDHLGDENFYIPKGSCPESPPALPEVNLKFFPFGGFLRSIEGSLQPHADMESHPPKEENQRGEKHDIEDEVFVHLPSIGQFGVV